jgi:hypothetical protein
MKPTTSLKIILILSLAGLLFSGYLSYCELFVPGGCTQAIVSCGQKNITIASLPACVYGFFMYLLVFIFSILGLVSKNKSEDTSSLRK